MYYQENVPSVLILTYARQANCITILTKLIEYGCKRIYLYLDAPKNAEVLTSQTLFLKRLMDKKFIPYDVRLEIKKSESNQGIAVSMINALDWFFAQESEGIVLEDDLEFGKSFLSFTSAMLLRFRSDKDVLMISGNRYSSPQSQGDIAWCNYPQTWGWAAWKRSWEVLRSIYLEKISLSSFSLTSPRNNFWTMGAYYVAQGAVDTWDIPIANFMIKSGLFTVLPPVNLVSNVGNDEFATHTKDFSFPMAYPIFELNETAIEALPAMDYRRESASLENRFLERNVFHISFYHLFLPIKYIFTKKSPNDLKTRLIEFDKAIN